MFELCTIHRKAGVFTGRRFTLSVPGVIVWYTILQYTPVVALVDSRAGKLEAIGSDTFVSHRRW